MNLSKQEGNKTKILFSTISKFVDNVELPIFVESINKPWVHYGVNNLFPDELISLYNNSGIHHAIVDSKTNMIVGGGVEQVGVESPRTQNFIDHPNSKESLDDIFGKLAYDYEIFGLAYINVIWSRDGKTIAAIHHTDASKIRWGKLDSKGHLSHFFFSRDWNNYRKASYKPVAIPIFNPDNPEPSQLLPIVKYSPGIDYYTFPSYVGGLEWIKIDTEISNFHLNNLLNGFQPTVYFGFPVGEGTEEEREKIVKGIEDKYKGTGGDKALFAFYEPNAENKVDVQILTQSDADKQYEQLSKITLSQILISHKVTSPSLVGIETAGSLGSTNEILLQHELFYNTVIKNDQDIIMAELNRIFLINGMNEIEVIRNKPIEFTLSETILKDILTTQELREMVGATPEPEVEEVVEDQEVIKDMIEEMSDHKCDDDCIHNDKDFITFDSKIHKLGKAFKLLSDQELIDRQDDDDLFLWKLGSGGVSRKNCPSCKGFAGQIRSLRGWRNLAMPRTLSSTSNVNFPHSPFSTFCEQHCTCDLILIN